MTPVSVALLLCSVVALSSACCTPDQWEGQESSIGGYAKFIYHGLITEFLEVSYDAINNRTAALLRYSSGKYFKHFKIVTRYDDGEGKLYVVDLKKLKCWTRTLKRPFRKACIPSHARSVGNYSLGLKDGFNVTGYEIGGKYVSAFISVEETSDGQCVPVSEAVFGRVKKVDFIQTIGFINIEQGIKNETVFDVPKECKKEEDYDMAEYLIRDSFIMAI